MAAFENKTVLQSARKYPSENPNHIETSQLICIGNELTGFYKTQTPT